jgi:hypothetical protein
VYKVYDFNERFFCEDPVVIPAHSNGIVYRAFKAGDAFQDILLVEAQFPMIIGPMACWNIMGSAIGLQQDRPKRQ